MVVKTTTRRSVAPGPWGRMFSVNMRRAAFFVLGRAVESTSSSRRPRWVHLLSSNLRVRGGATQEANQSSAVTSVDPFGHLPAIQASLLTKERNQSPSEKPDKSKLIFGKTFTDHMLCVDWDSRNGWHTPKIMPYGDLSMSPAASSFQYGLQCFEGMKAYKDSAGNVRLFRPEMNIRRLNRSMERLHFPTVDEEAMIKLLGKLILEDADWIPEGDGYSLYIRPTAPYLGVSPAESVKLYVILSPVGPYYKRGFAPVKLYADTANVRAWPGGMGFAKAGGNYAPTILPAVKAGKEHDCEQVLWLFGDEHYITEVGAMNIFFALKKEGGNGIELVTPPLHAGDILEGVTRRSVLDLAMEWEDVEVSERRITMREVVRASEEGRLLEAFGTGTAAVVAPVNAIKYQGREIKVPTGSKIGPLAGRVWSTLTDIQYGRVEHPWSLKIS